MPFRRHAYLCVHGDLRLFSLLSFPGVRRDCGDGQRRAVEEI